MAICANGEILPNEGIRDVTTTDWYISFSEWTYIVAISIYIGHIIYVIIDDANCTPMQNMDTATTFVQ